MWLAVNEDGLCVLDLTMVGTENTSVQLGRAVAGNEVSPLVPSLCSQNTLVTYPYQCLVTFGGCHDDFMVVTSQQGEPGVGRKIVEKLVCAMAKPKVGSSHTHIRCSDENQARTLADAALIRPQILELTLLMADYMNHWSPGVLPASHRPGGQWEVDSRHFPTMNYSTKGPTLL